ncbi:MAG: hydroxymethylbilane synthase [Deltaproteobacteria bacterium]|nr:hydroxymethylbilane synthase [Deltaproteobacteria bacterium]
MPSVLKIGTRKSPLALWQAEHVKARLEEKHPGVVVELVGIETKGDKILDVALAKVGGKGLFVKELEEALLDGRVDLCVHSTKDMPAELPDGTAIVAFPPRADPRDCLADPLGVGGKGGVSSLKRGARIGTSSLRRQAQLLAQRPDLVIVSVRGNVATRLRKVQELDLTCVVLACAGLDRLETSSAITHRFSVEEMLPAAGQGVLAIQARTNDARVLPLLSFLDDPTVRTTTSAERAFLKGLGGGCQVPIAAYALVDKERLFLRGLVARPDGRVIVHGSAEGPAIDAVLIGSSLALDVTERGGARILQEVDVA